MKKPDTESLLWGRQAISEIARQTCEGGMRAQNFTAKLYCETFEGGMRTPKRYLRLGHGLENPSLIAQQ